MVQKEEKLCEHLLGEAMENIGVSEQEFMQTHQIYMTNPQTAQILMQVQYMPQPGKGQPKLTREKSKSIFLESEEKKLESMKRMMSSGQQMGAAPDDQMAAVMEMMVEQAKLADEMFAVHGVEEDEFNEAMMFYNLMNDRDV